MSLTDPPMVKLDEPEMVVMVGVTLLMTLLSPVAPQPFVVAVLLVSPP